MLYVLKWKIAKIYYKVLRGKLRRVYIVIIYHNPICNILKRLLLPSVSFLHQVAKRLEFQLQHQSFQWTPRPISFRMDWLDLLVVQGTLKSLLQHHSSKASTLRRSAYFIVQLSQPYMTTGKTTALNRQIFVGKLMSLLFIMLSMWIIDFPPRNRHLLITWLQSDMPEWLNRLTAVSG